MIFLLTVISCMCCYFQLPLINGTILTLKKPSEIVLLANCSPLWLSAKAHREQTKRHRLWFSTKSCSCTARITLFSLSNNYMTSLRTTTCDASFAPCEASIACLHFRTHDASFTFHANVVKCHIIEYCQINRRQRLINLKLYEKKESQEA